MSGPDLGYLVFSYENAKNKKAHPINRRISVNSNISSSDGSAPFVFQQDKDSLGSKTLSKKSSLSSNESASPLQLLHSTFTLEADISSDLESILTKFSPAVGKGMVTEMDVDLTSVIIYYCLLGQRETIDEPGSGEKIIIGEELDSDVYIPKFDDENQFIVCFCHSSSQDAVASFDLFIPELDNFCVNLSPQLPDPACFENLSKWYSSNIGYINKVGLFLEPYLSSIFYCSTSPHSITIEGEGSKEMLKNLKNFCELCDLNIAIPETRERKYVLKLLRENEIELNCEETNDLFELWAKVFIEALHNTKEKDCPIVLRRLLESRKLKMIQYINLFKRLITKATNDHYALYQCHLLVTSCGFANSMMEYMTSIRLEGDQFEEPIQALKEFYQFQSQKRLTLA